VAEQLPLEWGTDWVTDPPSSPVPARPPAPDQPSRDRIAEDLATTLFVEAGAGSGKTTALVDRILALVASGVALRSIAAITFTDKAGDELRDRLRQGLEGRAAGRGPVRERFAGALDDLDGAAIGTLHAFAQRLLSENPVEAGLPPTVEVLDEVSSGVEFERRWAAFRDELLADASQERTILLLLAAGVRHDALRVLAMAFDDNWDLVAERVPGSAAEPPPVHSLLAEAAVAVDAVCAEVDRCTDPTDRLRVRLEDIAAHVAWLRTIEDELDLMEALHTDGPSFKVGRRGKQVAWGCDVKELQAAVAEAGERLAEVPGRVAAACARRLASRIREFTLSSADRRRAAGQLEFHDLLVLARSLLRDPVHGAVVRSRLHDRYERLLLDEFQDTDPIQIELAVRIAAADPGGEAAGSAPWPEVAVAPGHLFVVGDPKQSIYRFRRADISTFITARSRFGGEGGGPVGLTANFRTVEPIIAWINGTFAALMVEPPEVDLPVPSQPDYVPLDAVRPAPPTGPAVSVVGRDEHDRKVSADDMRAAEAASVVAAVTTAIGEGWSVEDGGGCRRPARLGDITILVPARTSLPFLEDALEGAAVPFRAESSSLVYATRAVRDLLMVLRAVDDPTDQLRTIAALRTPLLACGDDDLARFKVERRGSWSYQAVQPDTVPDDDPVRMALAYLRTLFDDRRWRSPSELLGRIAVDRRAFELGFAEGRPRDVWRRLRFVIDQARALSDATGGSLREYLRWVDQQTAEGARVAESVLPETDDDAVRIMTIHAAKGLEFPITIVSGMSTAPGGRRAQAQVSFPPDGTVGYSFGKDVRTEEFEAWRPIDEQMGFDERIRLLYVACTRARDHLVVSLHRRGRASEPAGTSRTNAELLLGGMGDRLPDLPDAASVGPGATAATVARPAPLMPFALWAEERDAALERARRHTTVAATALTDDGGPDAADVTDGLKKRPRDLDLPPWLKGRYGTATGRAVHGVLQSVDLATGAGLDAAVAAQCEAEAAPDRGTVRRLVEQALGSPSVAAAAGSPHWREVYACTPVGGRLLEGYVDLLYRGPDGLVVVDYKTAATSDPAVLDIRLDGYRFQGAAYAVAVGASTGEPVARVTFVFLTPDGSVERDLPDLEAAMAEVRSVVTTGGEVVLT
jgi:ATP-dependent exoDNAse (exonuclease V) beta subunit